MNEEQAVWRCDHIGVAGTTPVHMKKHEDGTYEARCGIAIMGVTNMTEKQFEACEHNPFRRDFQDNYAVGTGKTEEEAAEALKKDMRATADSIWAI